jgi:hypothetical protein
METAASESVPRVAELDAKSLHAVSDLDVFGSTVRPTQSLSPLAESLEGFLTEYVPGTSTRITLQYYTRSLRKRKLSNTKCFKSLDERWNLSKSSKLFNR